jgi:hypothetical protein
MRTILKSVPAALVVAFALVGVSVLTTNCTATQKQDAKTALNFSEMLCVIANADKGEAPIIATICNIDASEVPSIEQELLSYRQTSARERAGDAGAPASSASALPPTPAPASAASASPPPPPSAAPALSAAPAASASAALPAKKSKKSK